MGHAIDTGTNAPSAGPVPALYATASRQQALLRGVPVAGSTEFPGSNSGTLTANTNTQLATRSMHQTIPSIVNDLRLVYTASYGHENTPLPNNLVVSAAIEFADTTRPATATTTASSWGSDGQQVTVASAAGLYAGMAVVDTTTPAALAACTIVTRVSGTTVTFFPKAPGGGQNGDTLQFFGMEVHRVTFGGAASATIAPGASTAGGGGGVVVSDPVGIQIPASWIFYVRTLVSVAGVGGSTTGQFPIGWGVRNFYHDGFESANLAAGVVADNTVSVPYALSHNGQNMFKPAAIIGMAATPQQRSIAVIGDSISAGFSEFAVYDLYYPACGPGAWRRAINDQFPVINVGVGGETLSNMVLNTYRPVRAALITGCTHAFCNLGVNDIDAGTSVATIQGYLIAVWKWLVNRGVTGLNGNSGVIQSTITPNTTTTDGWATTVNQTAANGFVGAGSNRTTLNTWLLAGAPMKNGAAVAVGTSGAIVAGQAGHPLLAVIDLAGQVESAQGSGFWKPAQYGGIVGDAYINDGTVSTSTSTLATSTTAPFTAAMVGSTVNVMGAGSAGGVLSTAITAFTDSKHVTIGTPASTNVSAVNAGIGTYTSGGLHPSPEGHALMAALTAWATLSALSTLLA